MAAEPEATLTIEAAVRGYHVYKEQWPTPRVGERLISCQGELRDNLTALLLFACALHTCLEPEATRPSKQLCVATTCKRAMADTTSWRATDLLSR